jgi:hypothetical protein
MIRLGILAGLLVACNGDKNGDTAAVATDCGVTIDSTHPASGAADFYIQDNLEFELSDDDPTATITLKDDAGSDVAGTSAVDGSDVSFTPNAALAPSTAYTAELTYCGDAEPVAVAFTTSSLGEALTDGPTSLIDSTFAVDLASGNFVKPAGIGSILGTALENSILIGITAADATQLEFRGALSTTGTTEQDYCAQTLEDFAPADFSAAPYFEIPEGDINISVAGFEAEIKDLSVTGTFSAAGDYFGGGEVKGKLDARDLVDVVAGLGIEAETPEELCTLLQGFAVTCEECGGDNPGVYCVSLEVNRLTAINTEKKLGLVCDSDCHETCDTVRTAACSDETTEEEAACESAGEVWTPECVTQQAPDLGECPA